MPAATEAVDLTTQPRSQVQSAAFWAVKSLRRGEKVVLITAQEPTLLMHSLDLQLRHNLAWPIVEADGRWRVEVSHRADAGPRDALDMLGLDHKRLDGVFVRALQLLNRDDAAGAAPPLREFAAALRRHIAVEDGLLASFLDAPAADADPLAVMLREHKEILQQLSVVEDSLGFPEAAELGALCAILSGTLAKHEHREESNLFPRWRGQWARKSAVEREEVMSRVASLLAALGK